MEKNYIKKKVTVPKRVGTFTILAILPFNISNGSEVIAIFLRFSHWMYTGPTQDSIFQVWFLGYLNNADALCVHVSVACICVT